MPSGTASGLCRSGLRRPRRPLHASSMALISPPTRFRCPTASFARFFAEMAESDDLTERLLIRDEGFRRSCYQDSLGYWT